jgi:2-dehydro-3-deoxyphosphogluconate aldolase/(4S)-4-hydroxy-2-oxoglutarate aldolase
VLDSLFRSGIRTVELTMTTGGAVEALEAARRRAPTDAWVGMGTVLDPGSAVRVIEAGAQFVVAPTTDEATIARCIEAGVPVIPGALTPTEILRGWRAGASGIKVFPASVFGPEYLRHILAPLSGLRLIASGGIAIDQVADYLGAGAVAVGLGGPLTGDALAGGDLNDLERRCRKVLEAIDGITAAS